MKGGMHRGHAPMLSRSGAAKLVRTPAISAAAGAGRGRPLTSSPTSVVVPPMSITIPSRRPERAAAPRREFTGPLWKVAIGSCKRTGRDGSSHFFLYDVQL